MSESFDTNVTDCATKGGRNGSNSSHTVTLDDDIGVEILKHAFVHDFPHCHHDETPSPIPISHASRWWRRLALSTPQIWTCIHFMSAQNPSSESPGMVAAYLARSRNLPLSITIVAHPKALGIRAPLRSLETEWTVFKETIGQRYLRAWQQVLAHRERWQHCTLFGRRRELIDEFVEDMQGATFPKLEYLGIHVSRPHAPHFEHSLEFIAPNLRHIDNSNFGVTLSPPAFFSTLTELRISNTTVHPATFLRALSAAPIATLVFCSVYLAGDFNVTSQPCPKLRHLYLGTIHPTTEIRRSTIAALLRNAANLKSLHLYRSYVAARAILAGGIVFPTVERLTIAHFMLPSTQERIDVLRKFSALRVLHVADRVQENAMLLQAIRDADESALAQGEVCITPLLDTLRLPVDDHSSVETLSFVRHRESIGHPLAKVAVPREYLAYNVEFAHGFRDSTCKLEASSIARICEPTGSWLTFWDSKKNVPEFYSLGGLEEDEGAPNDLSFMTA